VVKNRSRVIILIDGSNFYFKLKKSGFHNLLDFDFKKFADSLKGKGNLVNCCYYVGRVRQDGSKKSKELFDGQQKLIGHLKNYHVRYVLGELLKSNGVYHEKGVDVQIAIDMVISAYEDTCERIILVSSDTDLIPAIRKVKEKGKMINYVGFSYQPSVALVSVCSESRLLTKEELEKFFVKKRAKPLQ